MIVETTVPERKLVSIPGGQAKPKGDPPRPPCQLAKYPSLTPRFLKNIPVGVVGDSDRAAHGEPLRLRRIWYAVTGLRAAAVNRLAHGVALCGLPHGFSLDFHSLNLVTQRLHIGNGRANGLLKGIRFSVKVNRKDTVAGTWCSIVTPGFEQLVRNLLGQFDMPSENQ
jgi:hypothetical protein